MDPCDALLHTFNLDANDTVDDSLDGIQQDGVLEDLVEAVVHLLEEGVERIIDGVGCVCDVAQDVLIDVIIQAANNTVGVYRPLRGDVFQRGDDLSGKGSDLGREFRDLLLHSLEQNPLAKAGEESRNSQGQDKECRRRRGIGHAPPDEDLLLSLEPGAQLDAHSRRHGSRGNVNDIHGIILVLGNELGVLLLPSVAVNFECGHRGNDQGREKAENDQEDDARLFDEIKEVLEKVGQDVVVGAKGQLLLLGQGKNVPLELPVAVAVVEGLANNFKGNGNGILCNVLHLVKVGQVIIEFPDILDKVVRVEVKALELLNGLRKVHVGNVGDELAKDGVFNTLCNLVDAIFEVVGNVGDFLGGTVNNIVEGLGGIFGDGGDDIQASVDHGCDETDVGGREEVDDEDDYGGDGLHDEVENDNHAVDGLFDALCRQLVDADREVVRHGGHGTTHVFDLAAGRQGLCLCVSYIVSQLGDEEDDAQEDEEEKDGPTVDPYLRESGPQAQVRRDVGRGIGAEFGVLLQACIFVRVCPQRRGDFGVLLGLAALP